MKGKHREEYTNTGLNIDGQGTHLLERGGRTETAAARPPEEPNQEDGGGIPQRDMATTARTIMVDASTGLATGTVPVTHQMGHSRNMGGGHMDPQDGDRATMYDTQTKCEYPLETGLDHSKSSQISTVEKTLSQTQHLREPAETYPQCPGANREPQLQTAYPTPLHIETTIQNDMSVMNWSREKNKKLPHKGALRIATLNIRGAGSNSTEHKWGEISNLMIAEKIDILALQETHLTEEKRKILNARYEKRLHIISTLDNSSPNKMGVALILNKRTTRWKEASVEIIIIGRAMIVDIPWSQETTVTCLVVYAPNPHRKNKEFWERIEELWKKEKWGKPTCMLGDFNIVEDSADRLPPHQDPLGTVNSLSSLKTYLNLIDGWRRENPTEINFTF